ncbi:hypothetical protein GIB67_020812 [Kingdonia uniflora]|uniref:Uncharacterized protein n=1 Tax=Kingdonia uniflora TaxID=39325 RepID=A0A7J7M771_9MAGN|nr:hypothetical protein GIB67_020812 [Kingdonia uniflora]
MTTDATCNLSEWTREQDKAFENALAVFTADSAEWWEKIAAKVPGKSIEEIKHHYELLVEDIEAIESGKVPLPCYVSPSKTIAGKKDSPSQTDGSRKRKASSSNQERRKGLPWSEEEHRSFLRGLNKYGKGDWRNISRQFVISRTPTQVASHAQKYFIRLNNSANKERRRSSIHDITSPYNGDIIIPGLQGSILTGQTDGSSSSAQTSTEGLNEDGVYGYKIGQSPLASAVNIPMNHPALTQMAYDCDPQSIYPWFLDSE